MLSGIILSRISKLYCEGQIFTEKIQKLINRAFFVSIYIILRIVEQRIKVNSSKALVVDTV